MGGQMSETVVQDTSFASESQAPRRDIVGEAMRAGAAVAEKLGHAAAIATVRGCLWRKKYAGCLDAAPLGPTTLQFHDDVRQPTGRWARMSLADLGAWFAAHGARVIHRVGMVIGLHFLVFREDALDRKHTTVVRRCWPFTLVKPNTIGAKPGVV